MSDNNQSFMKLIQRTRTFSITAQFTMAMGLLLLLMLSIAIISYISLQTVSRQTESTILTSTTLRQLVLSMDNGLQIARTLQRDFFLRYPEIGLMEARQQYATRAVTQMGEVLSLTDDLLQGIAETSPESPFQAMMEDIDLYRLTIERYIAIFLESVDLVTTLAARETGKEAQLAQCSDGILELCKVADDPQLMIWYREMQAHEKDYTVTRKRFMMQKAFNLTFLLDKGFSESLILDENQKIQAATLLKEYRNIGEAIIKLDLAIQSTISDFDLQAAAVDPISERLTALAEEEVQQARVRIALTNQRMLQSITAVTAVGLLVAGIVLLVLNRKIIRPIYDLLTIATAMTTGDLSQDVTIQRHDEIGQLLSAMKQMSDKIREVLHETERLIRAIQAGKLDVRGKTEHFRGSWQELVVGINTVISAFVAPINMVATSLDRLSEGNIPDPITEAYQGDFNTIKKSLNRLIDTTRETAQIAEEIATGDLSHTFTPRSAHDVLGHALVNMSAYLNELAAAAAAIAAGNLQQDIHPKSPHDILGNAFHTMAQQLRQNFEQIEVQLHTIQQEIAERKRTEEILRESERKYRQLTEEINDWVWEIDHKGIYTYVSPKVKDLLGYQPQEVLGKTLFDFMPAAEAKRVKREFTQILKQKKAFEDLENTMRCKNGQELVLETSGTPIFDEKKKLVGYRGIDRDITERKRTEEQIKHQNILLEQAVQEKQREMEDLFERLLRQEKLATIGQMAGSIAHELRNPLGAVKQSAFFLKRLSQKQQLNASNPKVKEHLDLIEAELNTSERVIADLLQMTRMKPLQRVQTNLRVIIEDAVERCQLPKHILLTLDLPSEPFLIWADPSQLRQVFINLLTNAVQAIAGDGHMTIRAQQRREDGSSVIEIEDDGGGIEPDALSKVFEPLYTTKATGTGLGLSICKQIIEHHQGQISVTSQPGQGTTVTIMLPDNYMDFT